VPILGEPGQMGGIGGRVTTVVAWYRVHSFSRPQFVASRDLKPKRAAAIPLAYYWVRNGRYSSF
jgi:hypothetical protein